MTDTVEALEQAHALIQEAKGIAGPGRISDHLDFAEHWLGKIDADLLADAERFRALMRCPRIKMQGSAGVNPHQGGRSYPERPGSVHFGAEFWPTQATDPATGKIKIYEDCTTECTNWGHYALRALADDILAVEAQRAATGFAEDHSHIYGEGYGDRSVKRSHRSEGRNYVD